MQRIVLTNGGEALVNDEDYELYGQWRWREENGYVFTWNRDATGRIRPFLLHRLVMGSPKGMHVHHKDEDRLNCQRSNLEIKQPGQHLSDHWKTWKIMGRRRRKKGSRRETRVRVFDVPFEWASADARLAIAAQQQREEWWQRVRVHDLPPPVPWELIDLTQTDCGRGT